MNYIHVDDKCFSETSIFCYTVVITFFFDKSNYVSSSIIL